VQTAADRLALRLDPHEVHDRGAAWAAASRGLKEYLVRQGLPNVAVTLERDLPARRDPRSGKLRQVCVECSEPRTTH